VQHYGPPAATLTGNGMVCTTRLPGGTGGRNAFAHQLRRQGIKQNNGRPGHPQTQGKAGRVQQTPKNWLAAQPVQPAGLAGLQALRDTVTGSCNHQRPHRSLPHRATPATAYAARPQAAPGTRDSDTHDRGGQVADLAIAHRVEDPGEQLAGHGDLGDVLSLVAAAGEDVLLVPRISRVRLFAPPPSFSTWAPSSPPAHAKTPGMPGRTISLGMIVTVSLDLPKRRSVRILTSPRVTVSPRNRLPHRARNGHAHGFGGG